MEYVIHKYVIDRSPKTINLPGGCLFLRAEMQHGHPTVWIMKQSMTTLDDYEEEFPVTFTIKPTGESFDPTGIGKWMDTIQAPPFVWHLFASGYIEKAA